MKNENFKKRLALALVPILSLTSVIGNVPILPTSVFAVTQDEVYIEEPAVIEEETLEVEEPAVIVEETLEVEEPAEVEETLEVEEPAVIVEETEEVEEPEALLNEVPEDLQNLSVVNKDVLNAASAWTITEAAEDSKLEYKVGDGNYVEATGDTTFDFTTIVDADVTFKVTNGTNKQVKTFTYKVGEAAPVAISLNNGEATIANAIAKTITAINLEFEPAYTISWTAGTGGTLKVGDATTSPYTSNGTEITVTITPPAGKQVATFTVGGVSKKDDLVNNAYKFTPSANTVIAVTFKDIDISWTVGTGGTLKIGTDDSSPYTSDGTEITATITPPEGNRTIKTFTVAGADKKSDLKNGTNGTKTYTFTPTADAAIVVEFDDVVSELYVGETLKATFKDLAGVTTYINAQTTKAAYIVKLKANVSSLALTLPSATKADSITLKSAKDGDAQATVAISNTTLSIPTALILDNVVLTSSAVNLTLSAATSALTVKAGGGIDKVVNVTTAAGKVITLEDTTSFTITGNLSGKPNITVKDDLEIAGSVAIGELIYDAAATVKFTKAATATATITKIDANGDYAAVLESGILSLTIGDIDVEVASTTGFIIKGRQYTVSTTEKTPVYKITGVVTIAGDKPIELSVYAKADTDYTSLAAIDPTTAIITSINTETTADTFKTSNKNADGVVYSFYKDGTALKLGNNFVTLNATAGEVTVEETFIRLQDAFTYIDDEKTLTDVILKVAGDVPSHGALVFPATDVTIKSSSADDQNKILFTGSVKLNANLTLMDIELSNGNIKGIAVDLNGKNLTLDEDSKVIFNTIKDTTKVVSPATKESTLNIKDSGDLTFLGVITAIGTVDIDDNTTFKGAVSKVVEIDIAASKYAYFRGGAITDKLAYGEDSIVYLPTSAKAGITKNITIKDTTTSAVTGTGKLTVNAVTDTVTPADVKEGTPEIITIKTSGTPAAVEVQKVNPGAVIVKLVKNSEVLASSFETESKNNKADTQTLIATKAGTSIKIAAPKLTATAPEVDDPATEAFSENFVTIEEALAVVDLDAVDRDYTLTITDNVVGADLTNIPAKVAVLTAAVPEGDAKPLKIATSKDIGLNGGLTIENLNVLAAAKTIGGRTSPSEDVYVYTDASYDLVLSNTSLTVKEGYIKDLTLQQYTDGEDLVGTSILTFRVRGYLANLKLTNGSTVGKISSVPVPET